MLRTIAGSDQNIFDRGTTGFELIFQKGHMTHRENELEK